MKPDERALLTAIQEAHRAKPFPRIGDIVDQLGMNEKRAYYILCKWTDRGWFNYGTSVFGGWLEGEGFTQ